MTDLDIFPRHELSKTGPRQKRAAAGHVVMLIGNLAVLFLDRSTPRRGDPRMVLLTPSTRRMEDSQPAAVISTSFSFEFPLGAEVGQPRAT